MWTAGWSTTDNTHQCFGISAYNLALDVMADDVIMQAQGNGWFWYDHIYSTKSLYASSIFRSYDVWYANYKWIADANYIIAAGESMSGTEEDVAYVVGQAYAIRALSYLSLATWFARAPYNPMTGTYRWTDPGVPVYTEGTGIKTEGRPRENLDVVYARIDEDIDRAVELLEKGMSSSLNTGNKSHINLYVAFGIKSRACLAEGDWEVSEMPDWCSLSAMSGSTKSELTLTIHSMTQGSAPRTGDIVFRLKEKDYTARCTVSQYDYEYGEDEVITLQKATKGNRGGINLVFLGDGYDAKDISEGKYLQTMREQMENFFAIEPYKTYRDYFNAYTAIAVSPESGIGTVNTIRYAKFETTYTGGVGLRCDYDAAFQYALDMNTTVTKDNLHQSLLIMVPNSTDYGGICQMYEDGSAIAFCPLSTYGYPLDTRGVIQHEAGGHGFGKLGDEYIYHNEFIDFCGCTCCGHVFEFNWAKSLGWYENLSLTGKMHEVPWSHLIFDEKYADFVDVFEGGFMHNRGVFRSEQNSCMNNDIPYYSTISREAIVKRIMQYAGEEYTFEKFKANDKVEVDATTRAASMPYAGYAVRGFQHAPRIVKGSPRVK